MDLNIRQVYFKRRLAALEGDRSKLAFREIETLKIIADLVGFDLKFSQVLDLGCGDEFLKDALSEESAKYTGIDFDDCDFDSQNLPYSSETFDIIICLAVIEHLRNPFSFLREVYRVCKSDGIVFFSTPNWQFSYRDFFNDYTHVTPFTPKSLEQILCGANFKNVATFPGLRCKPKWFYEGALRFHKTYYLFPFLGTNKFAPRFLRGHARSIFAIAKK